MTTTPSTDQIRLVIASTSTHFDQARGLLAELETWDCAQVAKLGLDAALAETFYYSNGDSPLPGEYGPPDGCLLLALSECDPIGCGAFSRQESDICELKRLYVRESHRGRRIGAEILASLVARARESNYRLMRLETVRFMTSAIAMYRSVGFRECREY